MQLAIPLVVAGAFVEAARHWRSLLLALAGPAAVLSLLQVAEVELQENDWGAFVLWTLQFPVYVLYATSCHRIVLLGDLSLPSRWGFYWTDREYRFVGWSFVVGTIAALTALFLIAPLMYLPIPFAELAGTGWGWALRVAWFAPAAYVVSRASMVLPATATDHRLSLAQAWELSRHNGWRLTLALAVPGFLLTALGYLLGLLLCAPLNVLASILVTLWFCLISVVEVTVLSVAFRSLASARPPAPAV